MTAPVVASRVKKARRTGSVCGLCGTVIITGQQIGKVPGRGWLHVACLIRRQPMIGPGDRSMTTQANGPPPRTGRHTHRKARP